MDADEMEKAIAGVMSKIIAKLDAEGLQYYWIGGGATKIWLDASEETLLAQVTWAEIESDEDRELLAQRKVDLIRATLAAN